MIDHSTILFTGGSGLLGGELKKCIPDALFPSETEFDITNYDQMEAYVASRNIGMIFHAAAFTSPPLIDKDPLKAIEVNIIGTCNIVKLCQKKNYKLLYVCTDYVFRGDAGPYAEGDPVHPVNKYAWSKLGGECAVRMYDNSIIIRTTFGPNVFLFEKAFVDQWTSRESVSVIARKMVALIDSDFTGIVHVGGERRTVFDYAKSLDPGKDIKELRRGDVPFSVPADTSLDCSRYEHVVRKS